MWGTQPHEHLQQTSPTKPDDADSTGPLVDEDRIEELLSEKLMQGFLLLERACPRCVTPLVKQEQAIRDIKKRQDINSPIPGVPFCVSCRAHIMTDERDIVRLQKHYHGQALQGRILVDFEKNPTKSLIDDETVATEASSVPGSHDNSRDDVEAIRAEMTTPAAKQGREHRPNIQFADVEEIELICSRNDAVGGGENVLAHAMSDNESAVVSVMNSFDENEVSPSSHNSKLVVKAAPTVETERSTPTSAVSKTVVKSCSLVTEATESTTSPKGDGEDAPSRGIDPPSPSDRLPSSQDDEHWPSFDERKMIATKILSVKMLQGHRLLQKQCRKCSMPMTECQGETDCVVCPVLHSRVMKAKEKKTLEREVTQRRRENEMQQQKNSIQKKKNMFFENAKTRSALIVPGGRTQPESSASPLDAQTADETENEKLSTEPVKIDPEPSVVDSELVFDESAPELTVEPDEEIVVVQANPETPLVEKNNQVFVMPIGNPPGQNNNVVVQRAVMGGTANPLTFHEVPLVSDGKAYIVPDTHDGTDVTAPTQDPTHNTDQTGLEGHPILEDQHRFVDVESSVGSNSIAPDPIRNMQIETYGHTKTIGGAASILTGCTGLSSKPNKTSPGGGSLLSRATSRPGELPRGIISTHSNVCPQIAKPFLVKKNAYKEVSDEQGKSMSPSSVKGRAARPVMGIVKISPQLTPEVEKSAPQDPMPTTSASPENKNISSLDNSAVPTKAEGEETKAAKEKESETLMMGLVGAGLASTNNTKDPSDEVEDGSEKPAGDPRSDEFDNKRQVVSKAVEERMAQGWILLNAACDECAMPLMADTSGANEICVYCGRTEEPTKDVEEQEEEMEKRTAVDPDTDSPGEEEAIADEIPQSQTDRTSILIPSRGKGTKNSRARAMWSTMSKNRIGRGRNPDEQAASKSDPPAVQGHTLRRRNARDCEHSQIMHRHPHTALGNDSLSSRKKDPSDGSDEIDGHKQPEDPVSSEGATAAALSTEENSEETHSDGELVVGSNGRKDPEEGQSLSFSSMDGDKENASDPLLKNDKSKLRKPTCVITQDVDGQFDFVDLPDSPLSTVAVKHTPAGAEESEEFTLAIPPGFDINNKVALGQLIAAAKNGMPLNVETDFEDERGQRIERVESPGMSAALVPLREDWNASKKSPPGKFEYSSDQARTKTRVTPEVMGLSNRSRLSSKSGQITAQTTRSSKSKSLSVTSSQTPVSGLSLDTHHSEEHDNRIVLQEAESVHSPCSNDIDVSVHDHVEVSRAHSNASSFIDVSTLSKTSGVSEGSSYVTPIIITSESSRERKERRKKNYTVSTEASSASPETIIILEDEAEEEDNFAAKEENSVHESVTSEAIDALLNRIEETQAQLAAAGDEEDSIEKREKLAELLDRLSAAAAAVEELDDDNYTTQTEESYYQ
eukprot:CAMPEP_0172453996 /NCGR_PEP_ID=MMETSP1065-20121228/11110_1 /TAXON_ID=265537 /ORGANISM="Amphiprora paludosa, Strain CCMP125" /LENGTH=1418 /DNA_ID=CAMNT_0013206253 /DNA_START=72 /DNA_END=4328 /DNA_ORIENTATION=-